jgi:hypothetical protein
LFDKLKQLAREPLVHFLCIGAIIYGLYALSAADDGGDKERQITITAGEVKALTDQWTRLWNRPPTSEEFSGIIRDHVRRQILYREAMAMGLDQGDIVIQRRLAQKVELLAQGLNTPEEPTEEVLRDWYEANPEPFQPPDRYTITHIFFDPDLRDDTTLDDARAALEELTASGAEPSDTSAWGDRFMLQNYYPDRSALELRKLFGAGFVATLVELEPERWHGPVLSGYGTHLVYIHQLNRSSAPAFEDIREQVRDAWIAERIAQQSEIFLEDLIARYEIIVEETQVPFTVPGIAATP